ncbi:hypothetical protein IQ13_2034 [Lacibacter cauensis]|uniref:ATP synthase protein I n=1 Tax=Lacibacter cauensis TaxID=510947 RepID=A0A562SRN6_9BACT|nr:hypothetical protein [Lacibacter cauensis]TWI83915.1 hypothetical protein IQ13_2034 [Lacibacter cauensis]
MNAQKSKLIVPILGLFAAVSCISLLSRNWLATNNIDLNVLMTGNLIVFAVTLVSLLFHIKGFTTNNAQVFLRGVYASLMIKMIVVAAAVLIYASTATKINRTAVYISMGLYFIYSFIEVRTIFRMMKQQKGK